MKKQRNHIESDIQMAIVAIARQLEYLYPELALLYHIPNGGKKNIKQRMRDKHLGELPGITDLCLPVSNGPFSSLYLELKQPGGRLSKSQEILHPILRKYGNKVVVCDNVEDAIDELIGYIKDRRENVTKQNR